MSSVFDLQEKQVSEFYDFLTTQKREQDATFSKLVKVLNRNRGVADLLSQSFDEIIERIFPEFNQYKKSLVDSWVYKSGNGVITDIKFYDYNKKEFIDKIDFEKCRFVKDYNFTLKKMSTTIPNSGICGNIFKFGTSNLGSSTVTISTMSYASKGNNRSFTLHKRDQKSLKNKFKNITQPSVLLLDRGGNSWDSYTEMESNGFNIKLDNYLNIYIPKIKTYIVVNYSPFPLASFYLSKEFFNINERMCYNEECSADLEEFNYMKEFVDKMSTFHSNLDVKQTFIDTRFEQLFTFFDYENKRDHIKPYQKLSEIIFNMLPNRPDIDSMIEDEEREIDPETNAKIIELQQKLANKELEVSTLQDRISNEFKKTATLEKKLIQNNSLISDLNDKIISLMDENLCLKKDNLEIIKLRDRNQELTSELEDSEKNNKNLQESENKIQKECEKYERLNKHMAQQILDSNLREKEMTKNLESKIDEVNDTSQIILDKTKIINDLQNKLIEVQSISKGEIDKLNKFIKTQQSLNEDSKKNKEYETFLLERYNTTEESIQELKKTISKQEKELKTKNQEIMKFKKNIMNMLS